MSVYETNVKVWRIRNWFPNNLITWLKTMKLFMVRKLWAGHQAPSWMNPSEWLNTEAACKWSSIGKSQDFL